MAKKLSGKTKKNIELSIIITIGLISIFFWNSIIIFPIKFSVILFHEISHGIFSIITGGKIIEIKIYSNLSGSCITQGGVDYLIASAGYLGSLFFGSALFLSAYNHKRSLWTNTIIAVLLLLFAINYISSTVGLISSIVLAVILFISPRYLPQILHSYIMKILGLVSCIYVLVDLKSDLITLEPRETDAQILFNLTGVPSIVWALLWLSISIIIVFVLLRYSYNKGITT